MPLPQPARRIATMLTVNKVIPHGHGLAPALLKRASTVELDWDTRQKSRFDAEDSQGRALGVFLPRGSVVRGGDVLVAEDGSLVKVTAKPQAVLVVRSAEAGAALPLLRAAYHLANRHVPLELHGDRLQLEPDHVLAEMLRKMRLNVTEGLAPFEPESGAYAAHSGHGHAHEHEHEHSANTKSASTAQSHAHVHGPDCKHDH
jgi:urease accessory protein